MLSFFFPFYREAIGLYSHLGEVSLLPQMDKWWLCSQKCIKIQYHGQRMTDLAQGHIFHGVFGSQEELKDYLLHIREQSNLHHTHSFIDLPMAAWWCSG